MKQWDGILSHGNNCPLIIYYLKFKQKSIPPIIQHQDATFFQAILNILKYFFQTCLLDICYKDVNEIKGIITGLKLIHPGFMSKAFKNVSM